MDIKKLSKNSVVLNFKKEKVKIELISDELGYLSVKFYEGDRVEEISKTGEYEYHSFYFSCQEVASTPTGKVNIILLSTHEFSDILFIGSEIDLEAKEVKESFEEVDALITPFLEQHFLKTLFKRFDPTTTILVNDFNGKVADADRITKVSADITLTDAEPRDTVSVEESEYKSAEDVINTAYILK